MKRLLTFAVAGCMLLGSLGTASAVDVKVNGQYWFNYGYYSNNTLLKASDGAGHGDRIRAIQRIRTQVQFIADENLKGMLNFENNIRWGDSTNTGTGNNYGAIDADNSTFVVKHAYLDWTIPNTQVQTRMGVQPISLPNVTTAGNPVLAADVAGVTVSSQFTPEVGLTVFWARPYDSSVYYEKDGQNKFDEMDVFGAVLPIKTSAFRISPFVMGAMIGKDTDWYTTYGKKYAPAAGADFDSQGYAWWGGFSFELPIVDPFFVKTNAVMGGLRTGDSDYNSFGYFLSADLGYKFSFGALSTIGWYSSGNKDVDDKGTIPVVSHDSGNNNATLYAMGSRRNRASSYALSSDSGIGMWGVGLQLADVSFMDSLQHTVRVVYMGGTNKGDSATSRNITARDNNFNGGFFLTSDRAWEIDLINTYTVSQNLSFELNFSYLWLDLGDHWNQKDDTKGSFASTIGVRYSF